MDGRLLALFAIQLARLMEQVHAAKIIHCDLAPENLMLDLLKTE